MIHCFAQILKRFTILLLPAVLLAGCAFWGGHEPLETLSYRSQASSTENLIVFLRGRGGSHESFAEEGFVDSIRERGISCDMKAPNAHFGYYYTRTLVPRLKEDVIEPAIARGYRRIFHELAKDSSSGSFCATRLRISR